MPFNFGKIIYVLSFLLIIFLSLFVLTPTQIFAQEKINNFDVILSASKDGSISIEENISYDFEGDSRHGIFRTIPLVSKVGDLYRIISLDFKDIKRNGKDEKYTLNKSAKETEVKIGDSDKTITGSHNYLIKYVVSNGIGSNYSDHDEIYWNVTGNNWSIQIESAEVVLKTDFNIQPTEVICFTGPVGGKDTDCKVEEDGGLKKVVTTNPLSSYSGLTIVASYPVNTFSKSTLQKNAPNLDPDFTKLLSFYIPIWLGLNFLLAPYLIYWYFKNKSKIRFGKPAVNFDFPKDTKNQTITPAEAGIIDNTRLERNDVIATIFDLAIRKFIKIEEVKEVKPLSPDSYDFKIIKLKNFNEVNKFEFELLTRLFKEKTEIFLKDLKSDFYITFNKLEEEAFDSLVKKGIYKKNPKMQMAGLLILGIIALGLLNIILGPVLIFLSRKLNGRTQLGDKLDWQVDGLKIFLTSMSRHHRWQAKNLITVEKYIPYALSFGLHNEFMKELKVIYPNYNPSWYSGKHYFMGSFSGMYASFSSNVTTSAPSSSSGFSSGSSGGGSGGGGGGSW